MEKKHEITENSLFQCVLFCSHSIALSYFSSNLSERTHIHIEEENIRLTVDNVCTQLSNVAFLKRKKIGKKEGKY
jgi:hypothetical protein